MSQPNTHNDLIALCQRGDERAQLEVYDTYCKAMYNIALRIVKDTAEAEDVMQEAFIKAFDKLHTFRGEVPFGAWLKRITVNTAIHAYRKQKRLAETPLEPVMYRVEDSAEGLPDHELVNDKAQKALQLMKMLKENYRIALTLYLIEGHDYEETAQLMGISYGNCRTLISRAKEQLRQRLTETGIMSY